ncbi:UBP-type zinc finger domain-containing protein [Actinomadura sp. 1N219]|uniref:UBP-type zinc finger domain-containing protein n=1 Tax=Actinomadura sp. 1N219 TaxID=3375152 RepID=UPI0037A15180
MGADHGRRLQIMSVFPISPNGLAPRCRHLDGLAPVTPLSDRCLGCQALGATWTRLRVCLSCGWVACSDDSPRQHGRAHYQETDHPVVGALEPGSTWKWCYVHGREV